MSENIQYNKILNKDNKATHYQNLTKFTSWKVKTIGIKQLFQSIKKPYRLIHKSMSCQKYLNSSQYLQ